MYNASVTKHQPTIRNVIRSTCSRRDRFKSWRSRQSNATPDATSITLSRPKPIRDTDPAITPATMETRPSTLLYPMVKYSSRWPRRTRSWRFGVVAVATFPLSPERTRGAKTRHLILDEGERSMKAMLSGMAASVGVVLPDRSIPHWLPDTIAAAGEGAWRLLRLSGDPPLTRHAAMVMARDCILIGTKGQSELGYRPRVSVGEGLAALKDETKRGR